MRTTVLWLVGRGPVVRRGRYRALQMAEVVIPRQMFQEILRLIADQSPYVWVGFFNATNLWRDRVTNFKPSRGMTINVRDVALS